MNAEITIDGITFNVEYDRQPKEAATLEYPGCPESIEINEVLVGLINMRQVIPPYWLGRIEEKLMELEE